MCKDFVLKGDICFCPDKYKIEQSKDSFLVCKNGKSAGVYNTLPEEYADLDLYDYSGCLIIPGLVDLHTHASQIHNIGINRDLDFEEWYEKLQEEDSKDDIWQEVVNDFVNTLKKGLTTRIIVFATQSTPNTLHLMKEMEDSGIISFVGKVTDYSGGDSTKSMFDTIRWINKTKNLINTKPIYSIKNIESVFTGEYQDAVKVQNQLNIPMQFHYAEFERNFENDMCNEGPAVSQHNILAHCITLNEREEDYIKNQGSYICICPETCLNFLNQIPPIRKYIDKGLHLGLGTDLPGGSSLSILDAMKYCIQLSKTYCNYVDSSAEPVKLSEVFYMATKGGGEFFGKCGSFEKDYDFDAVIIRTNDEKLSTIEKLEKIVYTNLDKCEIEGKFIQGKKII